MVTQHSETTHFTPASVRPLKIALAIVASIAALELVGGLISNSLALISDAGHMLVDVLALVLALFATTVARRPVTRQRTYGFHRVEIIAALANGTTLVLLSLYIFYSAYNRFLVPPEIDTPVMFLVAVIGLVANAATILLLRSGSAANLNIKAAFWHVIGDTVSSVGVIVAAGIIHFTGWSIVDPLTAVLIGGIILWGAIRLVSESADILLETVPRHIQVDRVIQTIKDIPGIDEVHDIHVWTITSGLYAMSGHLLIKDQMVSRSAEVIASVNESLARNHDIKHTTLQLECQTCANECVCNVMPLDHELAAKETDSTH